MAVPSEIFSTITTSQVDADSPLDVTLMEAIRGNLINVNEQLIGGAGSTFVAAQAHDHDGLNSAPVTVHTLTSGTRVFFRSTIETTVASTVSVVAMQVGLPWGGTIRVRFDMKQSTVAGAPLQIMGQVFRNGSAVGTEQVSTSNSYISFTEDIAGWSRNDLLQINAFTTVSTGTNVRVKNLILSAGTDISQIALGIPIQGAT